MVKCIRKEEEMSRIVPTNCNDELLISEIEKMQRKSKSKWRKWKVRRGLRMGSYLVSLLTFGVWDIQVEMSSRAMFNGCLEEIQA